MESGGISIDNEVAIGLRNTLEIMDFLLRNKDRPEEAIYELYGKGFTAESIATVCEMPPAYVYRILRDYEERNRDAYTIPAV